MNDDLVRAEREYRLQKDPRAESYGVGVPPLFMRNCPAEKGSTLQPFIDLEHGAVVYLFDTDEIDTDLAAD